MQVLLLMAGDGSRFKQKYSLPKPLIQLQGRSLFQWASDSVKLPHCQRIFVVRQEHIDLYYLDQTIEFHYPGSKIIPVEGLTNGQACSALLAQDLIQDSQPLFILNCDHYLEWQLEKFLSEVDRLNADGGIISYTSEDPNPKYCYLRVDGEWITEVAEKQKVSDLFAMGVFYFRRGGDFVQYCKQVIEQQEKVNGEYYLSSVFVRMIEDGKKILHFPCERFFSTGTIESLEAIPEGALHA